MLLGWCIGLSSGGFGCAEVGETSNFPASHTGQHESIGDGAATSPGSIEERRYEGRTLEQWRQRIKTLDLQSEQSRAAVPGLMAIVRDSEVPPFTRRQAAFTLGHIGARARDAVPLLIDLLDENPGAEDAPPVWAAKALALFGPEAKSAVPALIRALDDEHRPALERQAMLEPLTTIGVAHPDVVPTFIRLLNSPPSQEDAGKTGAANWRDLTAQSLMLIGPDAAPAIPALLRTAQNEQEQVRRSAVSAVGAMGPAADIAIPTLAELLVFDDSPAVRDLSAEALAQIGPASLPALRRLIGDEDPEVRWRVARSLAQLGPRARSVLDALEPALTDDDPQVRVHAWEAVWRMTGDAGRALPGLIGALTISERPLRMHAFKLLEEVAPQIPETAEEELSALLDDDRAYVRQAAQQMLDKLRSKSKRNGASD